MNQFAARALSRKLPTLITAVFFCLGSLPSLAADEPELPKDGPKGAAVTVLKAAKSCFAAIVEVSGIVIPREETAVRPERAGLKVAEILAEPGDTVTAGQLLARLTLPEGGLTLVAAPVAGLVAASSAVIGAVASAKGEALFSIIARSEFDLIGLVPVQDIAKLQVNQPAKIKIIGAGEVEGKVRRVAPTVEPNSQLGQAIVSVTTNRFDTESQRRACIWQVTNPAFPLYGAAIRLQVSRNYIHQCALAGAVFTQQRQHLARKKVQAHFMQRVNPGESLRDFAKR